MMSPATRRQRWIEWINYDETEDPVCPAFGCIEIFGFEMWGANVLLKGKSAECFNRTLTAESIGFSAYGEWQSITFSEPTQEGAFWYHAFNDGTSVMPGAIGRCTFDLPTWASTVLLPDRTPFTLGTVLFMGKFFDTSQVISTVDSSGETLYTLEGETVGERWRISAPRSRFLYMRDEAGWNTYYDDRSFEPSPGRCRALIGGARTFLKRANQAGG